MMLVAFPGAVVLLGAEEVVTVFADGTMQLLDIGASDNDHYRGIAAICGYPGGDRDFRRYARHHDLTHNWLAAERGGISGVLWNDANGRLDPNAEREEHWVNCLQRLWADRAEGIAWRAKELAAAEAALGPDWRRAFGRLCALLDLIE